MFTIGEFSKATGLTVKTLRFYHEQGLLIPAHVDDDTGYRYYAERQLETARVIRRLKDLAFPLSEIAEILRETDDDSDLLDHLVRQRKVIRDRLSEYRRIGTSLDQLIAQEREVRQAMLNQRFEIERKSIPPMLIAGIRMQGKYSDCGQGFARIGRRFGRHICGKPFLLHYDSEYKEEDADFEACMPVRKGESESGLVVRELAGGDCVSLIHKGPYEELGTSYARLLSYLKDNGHAAVVPSREVYLKGPGMIFRGNPKKYLTEIQFLLEPSTG